MLTGAVTQLHSLLAKAQFMDFLRRIGLATDETWHRTVLDSKLRRQPGDSGDDGTYVLDANGKEMVDVPAGSLVRFGADNMGFRERIGFVAGAKRKAGFRQWCVIVLQVITRKMLRSAGDPPLGLLDPELYVKPELSSSFRVTASSGIYDKIATRREERIGMAVLVARALKADSALLQQAAAVGLVDADDVLEAEQVEIDRAPGQDGVEGVLRSVVVRGELKRDLEAGEDEESEERDPSPTRTMFQAAGWQVLQPWMEDFATTKTLQSLEAYFRSMHEKMLEKDDPDVLAGEVKSPGALLGVNAMTDGKPAWQYLALLFGIAEPASGPFRCHPGGFHTVLELAKMMGRLFGDALLISILKMYGRESDGQIRWVLEPGDTLNPTPYTL